MRVARSTPGSSADMSRDATTADSKLLTDLQNTVEYLKNENTSLAEQLLGAKAVVETLSEQLDVLDG